MPLIRSKSHQRLILERTKPTDAPSVSVYIAQLTCTDCAAQLVRAIQAQADVERAELDYVTGQLNVWGMIAPYELSRWVRDMGYEPIDVDTGEIKEVNRFVFSRSSRLFLIYLSAVLIIGGTLLYVYGFRWPPTLYWMPLSPANLAYFSAMACAALFPVRTGIYSVFYSVPETNVMITLAMLGAVLLGMWPDAALLMFFFSIIGMMEARLIDECRFDNWEHSSKQRDHSGHYGPRSIGERLAPYYTRTLIVAALLIGVVPPFLFDMAIQTWLYPALILLVLARPGALTKATPVPWMAATRHAEANGVYLKNRQTWSKLARVNVVAFDLTGTLTEGRMAVFEIATSGSALEGDVLDVARALLEPVNHPAASALAETAAAMEREQKQAESVFEIQGFGAEGYMDGHRYVVGNGPLMRLKGIDLTPVSAHIEQGEKEGKSLIIVAEDDEVIGIIFLADIIRDHSLRTIRRLKAMGGIKLIAMLTEEDQGKAGEVAKYLGISEYHAGLSPAVKMHMIKGWQEKNFRVAMVGHVQKDSVLLSEADIGIGLGVEQGEHDSIDVTMTADDPSHVPHLLALARRYRRMTASNLVIACFTKGIALYLLVTGRLPMGVAALIETSSSLWVTWRSTRLRRPIRMTSRRRD